MIVISYQTTRNELKKAVSLSLKYSPVKYLSYLFMGFGLFCLYWAYRWFEYDQQKNTFSSQTTEWLAYAVFFLIFPRLLSWLSFYRMKKICSVPIEMNISEQGIVTKTPDASSNRLWSGYAKFAESSDLFLIFQQALVYQIVPKHAFKSKEDLDRFRELLTKIPKKK